MGVARGDISQGHCSLTSRLRAVSLFSVVCRAKRDNIGIPRCYISNTRHSGFFYDIKTLKSESSPSHFFLCSQMDNSNKDNQSTPDLKVISILYPNLILLLVYYAEIRFSWFQLPELLMAFREPNLKPLHMLRTVFGAADTHLRGKGKITSTFNRF